MIKSVKNQNFAWLLIWGGNSIHNEKYKFSDQLHRREVTPTLKLYECLQANFAPHMGRFGFSFKTRLENQSFFELIFQIVKIQKLQKKS